MLTSVRLDEKSPAACALTSWSERLHLCWVGTDAKLNLTSSPDGTQFAGTRTLPHRTLVYDNSESDYVFTAPALAGAPEHLYLAWTGTDTSVAVLAMDSRKFFAPTVLKHRSYVSPAVAVSGSAVPVPAWVGKDRRVNLLTLHEHGPGSHLRLDEARTGDRPAICSHQGAVLVAWTGTDRRVNLVTVNEDRVTAPVRLEDARSVHGPAVCSHRGMLFLAWTGTDAHLNVAHLPMA